MEIEKLEKALKLVSSKIEYYVKLPFNILFYLSYFLFVDIFFKNNLATQHAFFPKRIQLKDKNVLIVVSHVDDETIFAGSVLLSDEPKTKKVIIVHDGGKDRNDVLDKIKEIYKCEIHHLKLKEKIGPTNETASLGHENKEIFLRFLKEFFNNNEIDILFTHNEFGEYGHGQHREVYKIVKEILKELKLDKINLFTFGYAYPTLYVFGRTRWSKTLRAFSNITKWKKYNLKKVTPFSGIFKTEKYDEFFYFESNFYYPQLAKKKLLHIINLYKDCKGAWVGWTRRWRHYHNFVTNHIQLFSFEDEYKYETRYYNFYWFILRGKEPVIFKKGKVSAKTFFRKLILPKDSVRTFHDRFLLNHVKLNGKLLWIGWNTFCQKSRYKRKMLKHASFMDILDNEKVGRDKKDSGVVSNIIKDVCDLKGVIADETYDSIHCNGVLEYVDDASKAVSEMARILKKHGRILLGVPGQEYWTSGKNRPDFEYVVDLLKKNNLIPIEVWRRYNPDYYFFHLWKK